MRAPFRDRRMSTEAGQINLAIVHGLLVVSLTLVAGILALIAAGQMVPDALMMVVSSTMGGLIGYLSKESKSPGPVNAGTVDTLNVTTPADPAKESAADGEASNPNP